jgi:Family of unknown function (DUF6477)
MTTGALLPKGLPAKPEPDHYDRLRDLPRLLRMWPSQAAALGEVDRAGLVEQLRQMLRNERKRGLSRHWSYDLSRHAALLRAYRAEAAALKKAQTQKAPRGGTP